MAIEPLEDVDAAIKGNYEGNTKIIKENTGKDKEKKKDKKAYHICFECRRGLVSV